MRKLGQREKGLLGLLAVAAVAVAVWAVRGSGAAPAMLGQPRTERSLPPVPRIDLARIDGARDEDHGGRRDLFEYGAAVVPNAEGEETARVAPPPIAAAPAGPPPGMPGDAGASAAAPSLPPLKLWYIGSVENKVGVKVAVLVTERREVLTGQAGQVVANRYRIARIGLESVDLEDVTSGQSRRVPLKGN